MIHHFINVDKWNQLPASYRALVRAASDQANVWMTSKYDAANPAALKRLVAAGAQLKPFPPAVMDACLKASLEVYQEVAAANPEFKKVWENLWAFRNDQYLWWQVAEYTYDTYLIRTRTRT